MIMEDVAFIHERGVRHRPIGTLGKMWDDYLVYIQAMMNVNMPDGEPYSKEEGFQILRECYAEYASQ